MIHWNIIAYAFVTLCLFITIIHNFLSIQAGGMWISGKKRFQLDLIGRICIAVLILWTLIWGGFFWW